MPPVCASAESGYIFMAFMIALQKIQYNFIS